MRRTDKLNHDRNRNTAIYFIYMLLLILSPWILLYIVMCLTGGTISASHPVWNDELAYWHETFSFSQKGLNFGYYTVDEIVPKHLSFGTHGFGTVSSYLPYASLFNWNFNSIVLANTLYLSVAFLLLVALTKPCTKKLLLITIMYLTYMPLILYCVTSMSELLNYALVVTYFTLLHTYSRASKYRNLIFTILLIFTVYISCVRVIYIILLLPVLLEKFKIYSFNKDLIKITSIWIILSISIYIFCSSFISPYPLSFLTDLFSTPSIFELIILFCKHLLLNIWRFIDPTNGSIIEIAQRYFTLITLAFLLIKSKIIQNRFKSWNPGYFTAFIILLLMLTINLAAYDIFDWRDYRVIAPTLFGIILFVILNNKDNMIAKLAIVSNIIIIAVSLFSQQLTPTIDLFAQNRYNQIEINTDLSQIKYTPSVESKFENTIIVTTFDTNTVLSIPAGIGISLFLISTPEKAYILSKYLYTKEEFPTSTHQVIKSSPKGFLYQRIDN